MDQNDLEQYVHTLMMEIMAVLWANGQRQLHVGAMMRLLGVPEESAALHDKERILIDELFGEMAAEKSQVTLPAVQEVPAGTTIH